MRNAILFSLIAWTLVACRKEQMNDCFTSTGRVAYEKRTLEPFTSAEIIGNFQLIWIEDSSNYIEIQAGTGLLEQIKTKVEFQKLYIENTNTCNWVRSYKIPVILKLHCSNLERLRILGSTELSNLDSLRHDSIYIDVNQNAAPINLNISNKKIVIEQHTGGADITAVGHTTRLIFKTGDRVGGNFLKLNAERVEVISRSEIDCYVNASESLKLTTLAGGSIFYTGEAPLIEQSSLGEGSIARIY
jgi:hypothetical protein